MTVDPKTASWRGRVCRWLGHRWYVSWAMNGDGCRCHRCGTTASFKEIGCG